MREWNRDPVRKPPSVYHCGIHSSVMLAGRPPIPIQSQHSLAPCCALHKTPLPAERHLQPLTLPPAPHAGLSKALPQQMLQPSVVKSLLQCSLLQSSKASPVLSPTHALKSRFAFLYFEHLFLKIYQYHYIVHHTLQPKLMKLPCKPMETPFF